LGVGGLMIQTPSITKYCKTVELLFSLPILALLFYSF
jgi:hypothetical protein